MLKTENRELKTEGKEPDLTVVTDGHEAVAAVGQKSA